MFFYYLKSAFRNLKSNNKFTVINIVGFAFGISICLAIVLFLIKEYSYDRYHKNADEIVRLYDAKHNNSSVDYRVKKILLDNFPEIENVCLVQCDYTPNDIQIENEGLYINRLLSVDNSFFEMFDVPFVSGNADVPFTNINSAVVTESMARKLFGTTNAVGKEFLIWNDIPLTITGVIHDFPSESSIAAGLLVNAEHDEFKFSFSCGDYKDKSSHRYPVRIYIQRTKYSYNEQLLSKLNENIELLHPYVDEAGLLPYKDIYLKDKTHGSDNSQGNLALLKLLTSIAVIILLLAIINYINLTVAQQNKRMKDTGVRKTVGAFRQNLLFHYLSESVLVAFVAMLLAVVIIWLLMPFYELVFNTTLDINTLFVFPNYLFITVGILALGLISGIGPAIILSRISPVKVLSGTVLQTGKKRYLRNSLTIFQFAISIVLIFCVTIVQRQISYVKNTNPGFQEEQLLRVDIPWIVEKDEPKVQALVDELRKSPYVKTLSGSSGVPGQIKMSMGTNIEGSEKNMNVPCIIADSAFISAFQLNIIKGRGLQPGDMNKVCMVNETFYKHFEFESLENKRFNNYGGYDIIAVVKDFHFNSFHAKIEPLCIIFKEQVPQTINVKLMAGGIPGGMEHINKLWKEMLPGYPLKYQFYDDWFDTMYKKEERFAQTIGLFAVLAIVISCIGILGLATFTAERRIKEIGIRKVNGAKVSEILAMLNKDFVKWVVIAFVVATPIAYYAMNKWLENFAYKTTLSWWIFALAGLLALGIALLTVSWQSWRAATRNPVEALRYE